MCHHILIFRHVLGCLNISVCAVVQYMPTPEGIYYPSDPRGGAYVKDIKTAAQRLVDHGCHACGSVSSFIYGGNFLWHWRSAPYVGCLKAPMTDSIVKHGELTFKYFGGPLCSRTSSGWVNCICDPKNSAICGMPGNDDANSTGSSGNGDPCNV